MTYPYILNSLRDLAAGNVERLRLAEIPFFSNDKILHQLSLHFGNRADRNYISEYGASHVGESCNEGFKTS